MKIPKNTLFSTMAPEVQQEIIKAMDTACGLAKERAAAPPLMRNYYEAIVAMVDELRLYIGQPKARVHVVVNRVLSIVTVVAMGPVYVTGCVPKRGTPEYDEMDVIDTLAVLVD